MIRKETKLEKILKERGYHLVSKSYGGKHSEKTDYYTYAGACNNYIIRINIDYKREKVINYLIENNHRSYYDYPNIYELEITFKEVKELIHELSTIHE